MSLVATRPPFSSVTSKRRGGSVFTLHSGPNNIFAWHLEHEHMKTATVVFKRRRDAIMMANIIGIHVERRKDWPDVSLVENAFQLSGGGYDNIHIQKSDIIDIKTWDMESLRVFCVESYLDMVSVNTITKHPEGFKITGQVISLSIPTEFYARQLEIKLAQS